MSRTDARRLLMSQPERYTCYTVTVAAEHGDTLADYITNNFAAGLELVDTNSADEKAMRFYVATNDAGATESSIRRFLSELEGENRSRVAIAEIRSQDWEEVYRQSVKAERVGERILVRPTWVTPTADALLGVEVEIILDPKMAFGTGSHGTTRLCMLELGEASLSGATVADVGCGSGILAILAAKRGASAVYALDIDPVAVENAVENCALNGVGEIVRVAAGSADRLTAGEYDFVVANIILNPLLEMLPRLTTALRPGGTLILSGLLEGDCGEIETALVKQGFSSWRKRAEGEWRSYSVTNPV